MKELKELADKLIRNQNLTQNEFAALIQGRTPEVTEYLRAYAEKVRKENYSTDVYIRGLIEFTNYCKNNCYYCGIRAGNLKAERYRLTKQQILDCCAAGYALGFRTFVLQGGEDPYYTEKDIADIVRGIKCTYPDCAVTLSFGEHPIESYALWREAGADRYLLRHETADEAHYQYLHPANLSLENRKNCLLSLKELGYQVGTGFMVGSPGQTPATLAKDLAFIAELQPHMVGIGPFIPHHDTPFAKEPAGTMELTLFLLSILRIMLPTLLLPATTALGSIDPKGREKGVLAGANVIMPNLSPVDVRSKYMLYDGKICVGDEAAECRRCIDNRMASIGYTITETRGDCKRD